MQAARDLLGSKKIPIIWGPGRHGPGHNSYTYHRNPDDQIIEMFTELDKTLDENLGKQFANGAFGILEHKHLRNAWGPDRCVSYSADLPPRCHCGCR